MKRLSIIITAALAALLCSSCGEYIDENNIICQYPWQLDSVVTYDNGLYFEQKGFRAYEPECEVIDFSYAGFWTFSSESRGDIENGTWHTEIIPEKGSSFKMELTSFEPGIFIDEEHNGEQYGTSISEEGQAMTITHRHTDSSTFQVFFFTQIKH